MVWVFLGGTGRDCGSWGFMTSPNFREGGIHETVPLLHLMRNVPFPSWEDKKKKHLSTGPLNEKFC